MHLVVEYLRDNSIESLEQFGIFCKRSAKNPAKFSLNYDQIEAKDGHPLVNLCRGLVLRDPLADNQDYIIYARPFSRFYNFGTEHAAEIDWSTAVFEEKLDGTCCIVYYDYDLDTWSVATRSVPDADIPCENGKTFSQMFWEVISPEEKAKFVKGNTYVYELTGPENQIVIAYDHWMVTLLSCFNNETGEETFGTARTYPFSDYKVASEWLAKQPGHSFEGFVVRDSKGNRIKIKSKSYLDISRVINNTNTNLGLLSIVLSGQADDVEGFLPKNKIEKMHYLASKVRDLFIEIELFVNNLPTDSSRKDAAILIQQSSYASWIGAMLDIKFGKYLNISDFINEKKSNNKDNPGFLPRAFIEKILRDIGE